MTVIAGVVDAENGSVVIAADSLSSGPTNAQVYRTPKLYSGLGGQVVLGVAGSWRYANLIDRWLREQTGDPVSEDGDEFDWLLDTLVPEVRMLLGSNGALRAEAAVDSTDENAMALVAVRQRLFVFGSDLHVGEGVSGWDAIGTGHAVAAGALHALAGRATAEDCARAACEAACDYDPFCGEPVRVMRTTAASS